jgi:hypothetical protein
MASNKIVFKDFTGEVSEEIKNIILNCLEEASSEIESQAITRTGTGAYHREIASKWTHMVDRNKYEAIIGNPMENALWVEYGTGEYALNGDGRKGYWVFVKGSDGKSSRSTKQYTLQEAKQTVAFMRSKGLDAMYTKGTPPKRPLHLAFKTSEKPIKDLFRNKLGSMK